MRAFVIAACVLLTLGSAVAVAGQTVGSGLRYEVYKFTEEEATGLSEVNLMTTPFVVVLPLGNHLGLSIRSAWAEGTVEAADGASASLSGFTDTEVSLAVALVGDRVVLTSEFVLPTGEGTQTLGQIAVAGIVAAELLPFSIPSWGGGGSVGGDVATAFRLGGWGVGLSAGYRRANEFEPLSGETFQYQPGSEARGRVAFDHDVGDSGTFSLLLGYRNFDDDRLNDRNLFRSGERYEALASFAFAAGRRGSALVYGGFHQRDNGSLLVEDPELAGASATPWQQLIRGGVSLLLPVGRRGTLYPDVEGRLFRAEDGVGQGFLGSVGLGADLILAGGVRGNRLLATPSARLHAGEVTVAEGSDSRIWGWSAGVSLRYQGAR